MKQIKILSDATLIEIDGKRRLCQAILISARGGYLVSYLDKSGVEVKSEPFYKSQFKDTSKEPEILLVVSTYQDGEIKEIVGYTTDEVGADKKVKELNNTVAKGDSYSYTKVWVAKL